MLMTTLNNKTLQLLAGLQTSKQSIDHAQKDIISDETNKQLSLLKKPLNKHQKIKESHGLSKETLQQLNALKIKQKILTKTPNISEKLSLVTKETLAQLNKPNIKQKRQVRNKLNKETVAALAKLNKKPLKKDIKHIISAIKNGDPNVTSLFVSSEIIYPLN